MTRDDIIDAIAELAESQGFYGRLLHNMSEDLLAELVAQKFNSVLDLVLYIEG